MSTPSDFFSSDNEPDKSAEETTAAVNKFEGERRQSPPPPTGTGAHRQAAPATPPPPPWGASISGATPQTPPPPAGAAPSSQDPFGPPQEPAGPMQSPSGPPQEPAGPIQSPSGPPQEPSGPMQSPQGPAQSAPGQYSASPRHQQPPATPTPAAPRGWQSRRPDGPDTTEQTTIMSAGAIAAAREQATSDPGVGDFFGPPSGPNRAVQQGEWPPQPEARGPQPGPQPLFDGPIGGAAEPFIGGSGYAGGDDPDRFVAERRVVGTGWRKAVAVMTFGLIKPGPSAKQQLAEEQIRRIRASLTDVYVVAFVNSKGGVGKTTMAVSAGNAIARERGDRVIVVDVDTDLGNLSARFHENGGPKANIEALSALQSAGSYQNVRVFTVQNDDRLEMLSSQNDPRSSYRLNIQDFESAMRILRAHYNVILLDCGTSITSNLFPAIAKQVDCLVVVSSNDAPGLNGAWRTLSWLQAHGFSRLLPRTVIALNANSGDKPAVDMKEVEAKFREQVQEVVNIPYDKHLHEGGFIDFPKLAKKTQKAVMELAGSIAQYYPTRQSRQRPEELGSY